MSKDKLTFMEELQSYPNTFSQLDPAVNSAFRILSNYLEKISAQEGLSEEQKLKQDNTKLIEALKATLNALEKTVIYSTDDGVWINSRVKGSAMWGLQGDYDNSEEIRESFAESARLNYEATIKAQAILQEIGAAS